jgi:hypothetical protein
MTPGDATCWTLIHAAADGDGPARERFALLYEPIARIYFTARWQHSFMLPTLDDAVQDVFVECFKRGGVLTKIGESQPDHFRAYFYGLLQNIARRQEEKQRPAVPLPGDHPADETSLSRVFDRSWARTLLKEAARIQAESAAQSGERAVKRIELLRLRFQEGLAIRDIAIRWNEDATKLHHDYAKARDEFRDALRQAVAFQMPTATDGQLETACRELLNLLH